MKEIVQAKIDFYNEITVGNKKWVFEELKNEKISILPGFMNNVELVEAFYKTYYSKSKKRIVLCGINPGRLGAGKTGVPFLDFKSLKQLLRFEKNFDSDCELSAQFVFSIITHFGYKNFFDDVYLTNISWFGFTKDDKNFNYYDMDDALQKEFINSFLQEMDIVKPSVIVPLSKDVEKSLKKNTMKFNMAERIAHPYYYSNFKSRYDNGLKKYIETIENLI